MDERLIARIAADDKRALEALYTATKSAVYGFALSIVRHPQAAEDIMQETYVRVYTAAEGYAPRGKPMAWILTIARNLALMRLRERAADELPLEAERAAREGPDDAGRAADRLLLEAAMRILGDEERQIVILHAVAGLKHREIAGILGIPLPTVLSKYRRALSKLKVYLKEEA